MKAAIDEGYLDTGNEYRVPGFSSHDNANAARLSVKRAGTHLGVSAPAWVTDQNGQYCYKNCADPDAPHEVHFRIWSKDSARGYIAAKAQGDPTKLKFNPFERNAGPMVDDAGNRIR